MDIDLDALPAVIVSAVERGYVARVPPTMDLGAQRLFASLGIPVLFDTEAREPDMQKLQRGAKRKRKRKGTRRQSGANEALLLSIMRDGKDHTVRELAAQVPSASVYLSFLAKHNRVVRVARGVYRLNTAPS